MRFVIIADVGAGSSCLSDELDKHTDISCFGAMFDDNLRHDSPVTLAALSHLGRTLSFAQFIALNHPARDGDQFGDYMLYLEQQAGTPCIGWIVRPSSMDETLVADCAANHVQAILLRQRNIVRQAVINLILLHPGVFGRRAHQIPTDMTFHIPWVRLFHRIIRERREWQALTVSLRRAGIRAHTIYYEDWRHHRDRCHKRILRQLGMRRMMLPASSRPLATQKDIAGLVNNLEQIETALRNRGYGKYFKRPQMRLFETPRSFVRAVLRLVYFALRRPGKTARPKQPRSASGPARRRSHPAAPNNTDHKPLADREH